MMVRGVSFNLFVDQSLNRWGDVGVLDALSEPGL